MGTGRACTTSGSTPSKATSPLPWNAGAAAAKPRDRRRHNVLVLAARGDDDPAEVVRGRSSLIADQLVIPVFCLGEFWRVTAHPEAQARLEPAEAMKFLTELTRKGDAVLLPGRQYWPILQEMLTAERALGSRVFDYQIAAVCVEHRIAEILTFDLRFPADERLKVTDPLA